MAVVVPPGFGVAAFRFSLAGDPEEMVTTLGVDLGDAGGDFVEAANNIARCFGSQFPAPQIDSDWQWNGVRLWVGQDGGSVIPYESEGFTIAGSASGGGPVQNTCILQRKMTARAGRSGRGRMYWPCFMLSVAGYSPAGVLVPATFSDLQGRFSTVLGNMFSGVGDGVTFATPPVLLHSDATAPDPLTGWPVQAQLATQRRRLRK